MRYTCGGRGTAATPFVLNPLGREEQHGLTFVAEVSHWLLNGNDCRQTRMETVNPVRRLLQETRCARMVAWRRTVKVQVAKCTL